MGNTLSTVNKTMTLFLWHLHIFITHEQNIRKIRLNFCSSCKNGFWTCIAFETCGSWDDSSGSPCSRSLTPEARTSSGRISRSAAQSLSSVGVSFGRRRSLVLSCCLKRFILYTIVLGFGTLLFTSSGVGWWLSNLAKALSGRFIVFSWCLCFCRWRRCGWIGGFWPVLCCMIEDERRVSSWLKGWCWCFSWRAGLADWLSFCLFFRSWGCRLRASCQIHRKAHSRPWAKVDCQVFQPSNHRLHPAAEHSCSCSMKEETQCWWCW